MLLFAVLCAAQNGGAAYAAAGAPAGDAQFDTQTLIARGYSADVAAFFSKDARFLPGRHDVELVVNAGRRYSANVQFDDEGAPCFDAALLTTLKLRRAPDISGCAYGEDMWQGFQIKSHPGRFRVELTVPEEAFDPERRDDGLIAGGTAALLNYNVFAQRIDSRSSANQFFQARVEPGINVGNWIFRSRGVLASTNQGFAYRHQDAYVARPVERLGAIAEFGQINTRGDSAGGLPMLGFQIGSDSLQSAGQPSRPVQGMADSNAIVEVRQRGRLVYRTAVPPGLFTLTNIGSVAPNANLEVEITEEDGRKHRVDVPVGMGYGDARQPVTWQAAVGRYRDYADGDAAGKRRASLFATGEVSFSPLDALRMTTAAIASPSYFQAAVQATLAAESGAWFASGLRASRAAEIGQGYQLDLQGSMHLGTNLSAAASWTTRTRHYASPDEGLSQWGRPADVPQFKHSAGASLVWAHPRWGSLSYGVSYSSDFGSSSSMSHTISAGRRFGRATVSLAAQMSSQGRSSISANVSIPLGGGTLNAYSARQGDGKINFGSSYQNRLGRSGSYSLGVSGSKTDQRLSASVNMMTGYAQVGAGISQSTTRSRALNVSVAGALVYTNGTFGTASSQVGDTFAVVTVPGQGGVKVAAPSGTAITNGAGTAVIPSVRPYARTMLQLDTRSLPMNVRLDTTTLDVGLRRGSVVTREIRATEMRQLLLSIRDASGAPAPVGATILGEQGQFIGTIVGDGNFMLVNDDIGKSLRLSSVNQNECRISYSAPDKFDQDQPYEEAMAVCE
ncbi:fimbrial protein [Burkholderia ubonensis]|uniref:Fimbrial biogenesis outer membrane usher protein n=1 Tax=Burkholderia ubonensis TaxID=101571 RepID=A0AB74CYI2_9BURK|nr:fimbrial protein [Burkholderia ubonensis]PAJ85568.1 fimbrial protein [Burkholderia ubonensis]PAJ95224.1 fimbrial protein [Burkholderia ubonensis]PAJ99634.1 fimbrial protein [Burkholderia ubonensis]PAK06374.1 fimbrial protein [Burkholderia ubonensis]